MNRSFLKMSLSLLLVISLVACGAGATAQPTPTTEIVPTDVPASPIPEPTATAEPSATPEPTATAEPSATPEPTETVEPTATSEPTATAEPTADVYLEYTTISDDSGNLSVEVPVEWSDINRDQWVRDGQAIGIALSAAPNLSDFNGGWTTPGFFFGASSTAIENYDVAGFLDTITFEGTCEYEGRYDYEDPLYSGVYDVWRNCDGTPTSFQALAVVPEDSSFLILVQVQIVADKDRDALSRILDSFVVNGTP